MKFDLIVLGGGSGGIATAVRAASHGAKVAVVEKAHLGGTCVNLGCVPKKIMFNASLISEVLNKATSYGFHAVKNELDWPTLVTKRNHYISNLREIYNQRFTDYKISLLHGKGSFVNSKTIAVAEKHYQADHVVIATGSEPLFPNDVQGIDYAIDSDGFFSLTTRPHKVAIIGSGYIGVELAGILHELGAETHLLIRGKKPLSRFDHVLGETLLEIMTKKGIIVHLEHHAQIIQQENGKKLITCRNGFQLTGLDTVIAAVGREPRTYDLNLKKIRVIADKQGFIKVDRYQNTSVAGIYAIGDVTHSPALTPVAIAAGRKLADRLFGGQKKAHLNYQTICSVVFSHPPIATVGLSEAEALNKYGNKEIKIYKSRFNPMFDSLCENKTPTVMKLITKGRKEKIVGLHMIGYNADEILQGFGVAIKMGACKSDFDRTVAIHPTSAEELVTLR